MTYLVGISGPPRAGKDTLGAAINAQLQARGVTTAPLAQSLPMRKTIYSMLGMEYDLTHYETNKDVEQEAFAGLTIRQAMIALSERHVIPMYGPRFWARAAYLKARATDPQVIIVTDMGFSREVDEFTERVGRPNCMWVQLRRPGHSFIHDSRSYVGDPDRTVLLDNGQPGLEFFIAAARRVVDVAEHWGWKFS